MLGLLDASEAPPINPVNQQHETWIIRAGGTCWAV